MNGTEMHIRRLLVLDIGKATNEEVEWMSK